MAAITLEQAVRDSIATKTFGPADRGIAMLAIFYAVEMDADRYLMKDLGPKLQSALESLGLTPLSRLKLDRGKKDDKPAAVDPLDELDERRRARAHGTENLDTAVGGVDGTD